MSKNEVAILGAGMHPWGKWGRNFVEYGVHGDQGRPQGRRPRVEGRPLRGRRRHDAQRLPGLRRGCDLRPGDGLDRHSDRELLRRLRHGRPGDRHRAHANPGRHVRRRRSWSAPTPRPRASSPRTRASATLDPDWLRFRLLGATNPTYFGLYAQRRMDLYGATEQDFAHVKVKNTQHGLTNPNARYKKIFTEEEVLASPMVAEPAAPASRSARPATAARRWSSPRWITRRSRASRIRCASPASRRSRRPSRRR